MKKALISVFCLLFCLILGFVLFFNDRFFINSELDMGIFTIDCSLSSYNDISSLVEIELYATEYILTTSNGTEYKVQLGSVIDSFNSEKLISSLNELDKQFSLSSTYTLKHSDYFTLNSEKVNKFIESMQENVDTVERPIDSYISFNSSSNCFEIIPEIIGNVFVTDIRDKITYLLNQPNLTVNLTDICYVKPNILMNDETLKKNLEIFNMYEDVSLVYLFGDSKEVIDIGVYNSWLLPQYVGSSNVINNENPFIIDKDKVSTYVKGLAKEYNTFGKSRNFTTFFGDTITISKGDYGWWLNNSKMVDDIITNLENKESGIREVIYRQKAEVQGDIDYTNTYVEMSIKNQRLWMFKGGKLIVDSPIVTGNVRRGTPTPTGFYSLTYKQRKAVLRGPGYASPVDYWMPFNGDIGLHDATWNSSFGGDIYINSGSHGCVNLPLNTAKIIYENITSTTPIIVW